MRKYSFNSTVSSQEAEALKEMIFKRARERAESINAEIQASYTSDIQNDVMDIARDSFNATKNPFSFKQEISEKVKSESLPTIDEKSEIENVEADELGFPQRDISKVKSQINYKNKIYNEETIIKEVQNNMAEARANLSNKKTFIGALEFLNSQATIALIRKKGQSFDALA